MKPPPMLGRSADATRTGAGAGGTAGSLGCRTTGSVTKSASFAAACGNPGLSQQAPASNAKYIFFIDVLILFRRRSAGAEPLARDQLRAKPHRFGKQNHRFDSPRRQMGVVLAGSVYFR